MYYIIYTTFIVTYNKRYIILYSINKITAVGMYMGDVWRAQVLLTPSESKALIGKAVAQHEAVKKAFKEGIIVVNRGTTNYFVMKELMPHLDDFLLKDWGCGANLPEGSMVIRPDPEYWKEQKGKRYDNPYLHEIYGRARYHRMQWVIRRGELTDEDPDPVVVKEMGPEDVYIKGANFIDLEGNTGVAMASPTGTVARHIPVIWIKGIKLMVPVGLEKLIATPMDIAVEEAAQDKVNMATGRSIGLVPFNKATVINELDAIKILTGAEAFHIESGGVAGAEGAVTLVIKGSEEQVKNGFEMVKSIKGTKLPENLWERLQISPDYHKK
jgi:hypothetical protein